MKALKKKVNNKKPLSKKKKRLILVILAGLILVLAAAYTVFIAPLLKKEKWVYKESADRISTSYKSSLSDNNILVVSISTSFKCSCIPLIIFFLLNYSSLNSAVFHLYPAIFVSAIVFMRSAQKPPWTHRYKLTNWQILIY